ncbi:MAG: TolB family protein [Solirubrobacterales bacterium]
MGGATCQLARPRGRGLALGALLGLLVVLMAPARAPASFAGKNGRLAIQSDRGGDGDQIFTANPGGGDLNQVTHSSTYVTLPAFSRSATRIVFTKITGVDPNQAGDIFVMRSDGSHQKNLTQTPASEYSASFSPDGRHILFESDRTGKDQLYLMKADGSDQRRIISDPHDNDDPVFFPSGEKVAFTRYANGSSEIYTVRLDGTHLHRVTVNSRPDYFPDVSPDGKSIAFNENLSQDNPELYVMRADGSHKQRLTNTSQGREFDATFSPDGSKIAFDRSTTAMGDYDVAMMNADGTDQHTVLGGPSYDYVADWARKH